MESPGQGAGEQGKQRRRSSGKGGTSGMGKRRAKAAKGAKVAAAQEPTGARRTRATPEQIRQRVEYVLALYVNGYGRSRILRMVANKHHAEEMARLEVLTAPDGTDPDTLPALVWGEEDKPPAERTVDEYIRLAKEKLAKDGTQVSRFGDMLMGLQIARLSKAWDVARRTKAAHAMVRVVEVTNDMFALEGVIRPQLTAITAGADGDPEARTGDGSPPHAPAPEATMTEESAVGELARLLAKARTKAAQLQLSGTPIHIVEAPSAT